MINKNNQEKKEEKFVYKKTKYEEISMNCYNIIDVRRGVLLGRLQRRRVGRHVHWTFEPVPFKRIGDFWLPNSYMKEISLKMTELYKRMRGII